jgi:CubicO group peptidase (beta-lactamase class C family)
MKNSIAILSLIMLTAFAACQQNSKSSQSVSTKSSISDSVLTKIDSYLSSNVDSGFSGVALIADSNGIVFHKAYNGKGDFVDTSTAFGIASTRKSFVAGAIMQLQENGKLSVKDSLGKFFKHVPPDKKGITIHSLLTHTSGLSECECADGETDKEKLIQSIFATKMKNPVRVKWSYSNDNYMLLEIIVAQVAGKPMKDYIKENTLTPAGMVHTGFGGDEVALGVTVAPLHDSLKAMPRYSKRFKNGVHIQSIIMGMFSTSTDLYKWSVALRQKKILSSPGLDASFYPYKEAVIRNEHDTAIYYGYGWIPTMAKDKRINVFGAGREDWDANNRIYILENGITIIVWSMDKKGPDSDAMATILTKELVSMLEK